MTAKTIAIVETEATVAAMVNLIADKRTAERMNATADGRARANVRADMVPDGPAITDAATVPVTTQETNRAEVSPAAAIWEADLTDRRTIVIGATRRRQKVDTTGTTAGATARQVSRIVTRANLIESIRGRSAHPITGAIFKQTSGAHIATKAQPAIGIGSIAQATKSRHGLVTTRQNAGVAWTRCAIGISAVVDRKVIDGRMNAFVKTSTIGGLSTPISMQATST